MANNIIYREMRPSEYAQLENFLYEAIFIPEGVALPPRDIIYHPELYMYIDDFGNKPADHAVVAEINGQIIGAAWARIMNDYGHVDDNTPSLSISLYGQYRGKGIGTQLWDKLLTNLRGAGFQQVSLSVQKNNFALKLYRRSGFYVVKENEEDYVMLKKLT
jgi:acetyltransferase, GNAT family